MAENPRVYVDNNEKIYFHDQKTFSNIKESSASLQVGLEDAASLPGQSTWIIQKIHFAAQVYTDYDIDDMEVMPFGKGLLGIAPSDNVASLPTVESYQDLRGWPLNGTYRPWSIPVPVNVLGDTVPEMLNMMRTSFSGTYTPKSTLALNRMQSIHFNIKNDAEQDCYGLMSLFISAKRGD